MKVRPIFIVLLLVAAWGFDFFYGVDDVYCADGGLTFFIVATILSTLAQTYFQQKAADEQAKIADENAERMEMEADARKKSNRLEAESFDRRQRAAMGTQKAMMGKSGASLFSQSFQEVKAESKRNIALDKEIIKQRGLAAYRQLKGQARIHEMEAESIRTLAPYRAGMTLLGGASSIAGASYGSSTGGTTSRSGAVSTTTASASSAAYGGFKEYTGR